MTTDSSFEIVLGSFLDADPTPVLRIEKITSARVSGSPFDHPAFQCLRPHNDQPCLTITDQDYYNVVAELSCKFDSLAPSTFDPETAKAITLVWNILHKYIENQFQPSDYYYMVTLDSVTVGHKSEIEIRYFVPPELFYLLADGNGSAFPQTGGLTLEAISV